MSFTQEQRAKGGKAVAAKFGSEYMRKLGKKRRRKQLKEKKV